MSDPATNPEDDDERIAELIADTLVELALQSPGPLRLAALQMAELLPAPGSPLSQDTLAAVLGLGRKRIARLEARFLARCRRLLLTDTDP